MAYGTKKMVFSRNRWENHGSESQWAKNQKVKRETRRNPRMVKNPRGQEVGARQERQWNMVGRLKAERYVTYTYYYCADWRW